jgi:hypothetical protein
MTATGYEPYLDQSLLEEAHAADANARSGGGTVILDGMSEAAAYRALLVHRLIIQEEGMAVATACGVPSSSEGDGHDEHLIPVQAVTSTRWTGSFQEQ